MNKKIIVVIFIGIGVWAAMIFNNDKRLKKESRAALVELCTNYEYVDKLKLDSAIDRFNASVNRVRFLNVEQEEQAVVYVKGFQATLKWAEDGVKRAEDFLATADSDYAKSSRRESLEQKKRELEQKKKEFSEKLRLILNAY